MQIITYQCDEKGDRLHAICYAGAGHTTLGVGQGRSSLLAGKSFKMNLTLEEQGDLGQSRSMSIARRALVGH